MRVGRFGKRRLRVGTHLDVPRHRWLRMVEELRVDHLLRQLTNERLLVPEGEDVRVISY